MMCNDDHNRQLNESQMVLGEFLDFNSIIFKQNYQIRIANSIKNTQKTFQANCNDKIHLKSFYGLTETK